METKVSIPTGLKLFDLFLVASAIVIVTYRFAA
jgi:hypothetical protein